MTSKVCFKCACEKPIEAFYRHAQMADGHLNKCKACAKTDVHNHRHGKGRDGVLAYDRARAKTAERKGQAREMISKWKEEHPKRRLAQVTLGNAVRSGVVKKQPCWACGDKAEAHHPDYDRPLDVVWLCPAHHKQTHALIKTQTFNA